MASGQPLAWLGVESSVSRYLAGLEMLVPVAITPLHLLALRIANVDWLCLLAFSSYSLSVSPHRHCGLQVLRQDSISVGLSWH
jgi:hypothetical protein